MELSDHEWMARRRRLFAVAFGLLGGAAIADDAYGRARPADRSDVVDTPGWLTAIDAQLRRDHDLRAHPKL